MGYGEVVGNESVHWTVVYEDEGGRETGSVKGRDPIKFTSIGSKRASKKRLLAKLVLGKPNFRVRLMYATKEAAQRAKDSAEIVESQGSYFLLLNAPAVRRRKEKVDPPTPPAEVRVDW
jgi:hypothetical protein